MKELEEFDFKVIKDEKETPVVKQAKHSYPPFP